VILFYQDHHVASFVHRHFPHAPFSPVWLKALRGISVNTGQTILTIVAIVFLGSNVVNVNRTFMQHGVILQQTEIGLFATSAAVSLIEEAQGKAFDKNSLEGFLQSASECTPPDSLGPEPGEKRVDWNDFDDYNKLRDTVKIKDVDTFLRWATVCYVDSTLPNIGTSSRTFSKRLTVCVRGLSSQDTVRMSYLFSYWSFR
jgi:hypothetical protein